MSQSDWKDYGYQMTVSLFGHTVENTTMSTKEALMIQFAVTNTNGTLNVMNPEVIYLSQGMTKAHLAKQEDGADVTLTAAETSGDRLMVEGTFQADLVFTEVMKRKKDPENVLNIAGTFKADIGPVR
ncbi:hypothetical protein [Sulfitobacter aestuariivivens]|uniref:YceI family protein n=1 Tax=Sulfitobacter aestuariivivens TaxID=2766981 RepID=A0A927D6P8_9RHOB|nr:hypothetical protein [Sulfitobacter aestuariivivens]MBD3664212.1 hypothetical protein [Sulfitobacter aestuariivivens]